MRKNNIKSFICSFIFSILAVFAVQKVFLHIDKTENIKQEPSDHIAQQKIPLFAANIAKKKEKPVLLASKNEQIPADRLISKTDLPAFTVAQNEDITVKLPKQTQPEVSQDKPQQESVLTDLAYAQEITFSQKEKDELAEQKQLSETSIVYADISDTFEQDPLQTANAESLEEIPLMEDNITVHKQINLQNSAQASQIAMVEPNALINTLEEEDLLEDEKNLAEADIKKSELGKITSISDIEDIDESAWQTATAATEESEALEDIQNDTSLIPEDSPWVIAKGNKYAKNQAAVEAYGTLPVAPAAPQVQDEPQAPELTLPEEESIIENIMPTQSEEESISQTFNEPLLKEKENGSKLAYEMIQNILIPIPDNILNDANIVPDLSSSPDGVKNRDVFPSRRLIWMKKKRRAVCLKVYLHGSRKTKTIQQTVH